jgi:hypothetical protein
MANGRGWIVAQFRAFESFPKYFAAISARWQELLFGEGVLAVVLLVWWALLPPPTWAVIPIFVCGLYLAGYYAWRAEYVRLLPKIAVRQVLSQTTITATPGLEATYVQLLPFCLTDAPIEGCEGHLLAVHTWSTTHVRWEPTAFDEPLNLLWSMHDVPALMLRPGVPQRLNVCWSNNQIPAVQPAVSMLPLRYQSVMNITDRFRLSIRITGKECEPVDVMLEMTFNGQWNSPRLTLL